MNDIASGTDVTGETSTTITGAGDNDLDMVIAFDTTGSMYSYLTEVKKRIVNLLDEVFEKSEGDLRIQVIAFGDYCDMRSSTSFGYAYQKSVMTNNKNELIKFVQNAKRTGGGDGDEFYELVIKKVLDETDWRELSQKVLFLVGDADPHEVGYSCGSYVRNAQIDWRDEARRAASMGVCIDTLSIHGNRFYKTISEMTDGANVDFRSAEKLDNVIQGLTYARTSRTSFMASQDAAVASGDDELVGAYKTMSQLL